MKLLLENQLIDTTGTQDTFAFKTQQSYQYGTAVAYGTDFDGCTVTLEFSPDGGTTWITVGTDTTFTSEGGGNFYLPGSVSLRFSVSSAGASTDVNAGIL